MVWTTPPEKAHIHQSWHKFEKGLCAYCGYFCKDCPVNVATCKCEHDSDDKWVDKNYSKV